MTKQPKYGTQEYAAMNREMEMEHALEADGEKLRQLTGEEHGPFTKAVDNRIQSLAIFIAVEIVKQGNEVDNFGDGRTVVLTGKYPTINVVQLAEKISAYHNTEVAILKRRIDELKDEITDFENAQI